MRILEFTQESENDFKIRLITGFVGISEILILNVTNIERLKSFNPARGG